MRLLLLLLSFDCVLINCTMKSIPFKKVRVSALYCNGLDTLKIPPSSQIFVRCAIFYYLARYIRKQRRRVVKFYNYFNGIITIICNINQTVEKAYTGYDHLCIFSMATYGNTRTILRGPSSACSFHNYVFAIKVK